MSELLGGKCWFVVESYFARDSQGYALEDQGEKAKGRKTGHSVRRCIELREAEEDEEEEAEDEDGEAKGRAGGMRCVCTTSVVERERVIYTG